MKVWILASKFGQGHWSAAEALKEQYEEQGHEVIISDVIEIIHPKLHQAIYSFFRHVICRFSLFYNFVNKFGRNPKKEKFPKRKLQKAYQLLNPDLIVTTWSAAARMLDKTQCNVEVVVTDFGVHKGWVSPLASLYRVADISVKKKLITYGVDPNIIQIEGIPVKRKFTKRIYPRYGSKNILIMGGGLGICPWIDKLLDQITLFSNISITVMTGNNQALFKKIKRKYPSVKPVAFTLEIERYLKEASIVISKPGGVSLAESIAVGVPFIAIYPSFEHELENAHYIETHHCGAVVRKGEALDSTILNYLFLEDVYYDQTNFIDKKETHYDMVL